jgi:AmmeMemoRadiSam system protein B
MSRGKKVEVQGRLLALVIPHWWPYAHSVAAEAFRQLVGEDIRTVVIMSNRHGAAFKGVAIDSSEEWETPLGSVRVNRQLAAKMVQGHPLMSFDDKPFRNDHTIENLLPFIQHALGGVLEIVPILFGRSYQSQETSGDYQAVAGVLASHLEREDIVVVSSDMAHSLASLHSTVVTDTRSLEIICRADIDELTAWQRQVRQMAGVEAGPILCCASDALKTVLQLYNNLEGEGDIRALAYGARPAAGFASILISKERPVQ